MNQARLFKAVCASMALASSAVGQATVPVTGTLRYEGRKGAAADAGEYGMFACRGVKVELLGAGDAVLQTTYANDLGVYLFGTEIDPDLIPSVKIKVYAESKPLTAQGGAQVLNVMNTAGTSTFSWTSSAIDTTVPGTAYTHDFKDRANIDYAMGVHDMYVTPMRYLRSLNGTTSGATSFAVPVKFPTTVDTTFWSNTDNNVTQLLGDRYDWDVSGHEFGHGVAKFNGFEQTVGGFHSAAANLRFERGPGTAATTKSPDYDFEKNCRLAFGEGFATYFGLVAQKVQGTPGNQRSNDLLYHDNDDSDGIGMGTATSIETRDAGFLSLGEDSEGSVERILWDLYDSSNEVADRDRVSLGDQKVWNTINKNNTVTLNQFWSELSDGATNKQKIDYGAIFEAHNVSPEPVDGANPVIVDERDGSAKLIWKNPTGKASSGGAQNKELLDTFQVKIFDANYNEVPVGSGLIKDTAIDDLTNELSFTLDASALGLMWEGNSVNGYADFYWVVTGGNLDFDTTAVNFETGMYWSDARHFALVPEPASMSALLMLGMLARRRAR